MTTSRGTATNTEMNNAEAASAIGAPHFSCCKTSARTGVGSRCAVSAASMTAALSSPAARTARNTAAAAFACRLLEQRANAAPFTVTLLSSTSTRSMALQR